MLSNFSIEFNLLNRQQTSTIAWVVVASVDCIFVVFYTVSPTHHCSFVASKIQLRWRSSCRKADMVTVTLIRLSCMAKDLATIYMPYARRSGEYYITVVRIRQRKLCLCVVPSARWKFTDVETKSIQATVTNSNRYGKRKHIAVFLTVRVRTWGRCIKCCIISRSVRQQFFLLRSMNVSHLQLTETGRRCFGISLAEVTFNNALLINL